MWLSECISYTNISRVLDRFETPENVYVATYEQLSKIISKGEVEKIMQKDFARADEILEDCFNKEIEVFCINDSKYPDLLRNINNPPLVLYMKGRMPDLDHKASITIIGTREATIYGQMVTKKLSYALALEGLIIVSGMARGIDSIANKAAIVAKTPTIAVLGCSVDYCYPQENRHLMDDIIAVGAVISEFPPTTKPHPANFPRRNRIMSGISRGVLVVEAPKKSGTLITAGYALEQGRDIFAIPGNIDNKNSAGCNELIKIGAKMVTSAHDVVCEYCDMTNNELSDDDLKNTLNVYIVEPKQRPYKNPNKRAKTQKQETKIPLSDDINPIISIKRSDMSDDESKIYDIIADGTEMIDEIIEKSKFQASQAMIHITMLEINGDIENIENRMKIKEK